MKLVIIVIHLLLILSIFTGCLFNYGKTESKDSGTYTLKVEPTEIVSYPGGGGLFIITMKHSEDFEGEIRLTVSATPALNFELTTDLLSLDKWVAEVVIYPDSTMATGTYAVRVISEHADVKDELDLVVEIVEFNPLHLNLNPPDSKFIEFVQWVEGKYPNIVFKDGEKWFCYFKHPDYDGANTWMFLSPTFEITIMWPVLPSSPTFYLLIKRGEVIPVLGAKKEVDGELLEITSEEWGMI